MSYIDDYLIYTEGTEVPPAFHRWGALMTLSCITSRLVWTQQGAWSIYPALYILLVGDPASGKSVALSMAQKLVRDSKLMPLAPSSITLEALAQSLSGKLDDTIKGAKFVNTFKIRDGEVQQISHVAVFANEFITFLGVEPIRMINFLTDIWGTESHEVQTKNKGHDIIDRPYVTLMGCIPPHIFNGLVKQQLITGGFARRCLFIDDDERTKPVPRPVFTPRQHEAYQRCLVRAQQIRTLRGPFIWEKNAEIYFDDWYHANHARMHDPFVDDATKTYLRAKDSFALKLAMLLQVSDSDALFITRDKLHQAITILDEIEGARTRALAGAGRNELAGVAIAILNYLRAAKVPVHERALRQKFFAMCNDNEFAQIIVHLTSTNEIKKIVTPIGAGLKIEYEFCPKV